MSPTPRPPRAAHPSKSRPVAAAAAAAALLGGALALTAGPGTGTAGAATGNLLANGGFESGAGLSGWTCSALDSAVTTLVHSGSYALSGAASAGDDAQCAQTVAVQPNTAYTLTGWVQGAYVYLGATGTGVSASAWTPSASGWTQLSTTFTTGAATTSVQVYTHGWYGQGTYTADDLALSGPSGNSASPTPTYSPTPTPTPTPTATPTPTPTPTATSGGAGGTVVQVSTSAQLKAALAAAVPGQTIQLADGTYTGNFTATTPGTAAARITLTGSRAAVLTTSTGGGYGLHLDGASYWTVQGISVTHAQKGIVMDAANYVVIDSVDVGGLTMEGVHFRDSSSHGVLEDSVIHDTGSEGNGEGEGVYVGTANTLTDNSDDVQILDNTIGPNVGAENIDLKEGTTGGLVQGNTFDGNGETDKNYDDSWVDVKGNDYTIVGNTGVHTIKDGFQTHQQDPGWGCGTVFRDNHSDLTGTTVAPSYAIDVTDYDAATCPVTVTDDNTVTGGDGLVNPGIPVTPAG